MNISAKYFVQPNETDTSFQKAARREGMDFREEVS
jgi:hypothetical protein